MTAAPTVLVAADLDRTLIYSAAALALPPGADAAAPRLVCVELYDGLPLSFVTGTAAALLSELLELGALVPVTTRTVEQLGRVRLPGPPPRYAVCANGGHLLVDGEPDLGWAEQVSERLSETAEPLDVVRRRLAAVDEQPWVLKRREADGLFTYLVVDLAALPTGFVAELADWCRPRGWVVSLQGRKLYAVPATLTKSAAVAEVRARTGAIRVVSAGDSLLDADLLLCADEAVRPGHGELAAQGWTAPSLTVLEGRGVLAGEAVARWLHGRALVAGPTGVLVGAARQERLPG